jgi:hypothetical protein
MSDELLACVTGALPTLRSLALVSAAPGQQRCCHASRCLSAAQRAALLFLRDCSFTATARLPAPQVLAGRQPLTCEGLAAVGSLGDLTALMVADYRDAPLCLHQGCLQGGQAGLPLLGAWRGLRVCSVQACAQKMHSPAAPSTRLPEHAGAGAWVLISRSLSFAAGLAGSLRGLRSLKLSTHDIVHHELRPEVFAGFR